MKLRFYFSLRSPFAAIALVRLRHVELPPDCSVEPVPVWPDILFGGHMDNPTDNLFKMAYLFEDAARQAEVAGLDSSMLRFLHSHFTLEEGADYSTKKVGVPISAENWALPHCALLHAFDAGKGWELGELMALRRFDLDGEGRANLEDPDVVAELAESVGLEGKAATSAFEQPEYRERIRQIQQQGEKDGVFGVPFFVLEREGRPPAKFWGNDRLEYVLREIREADALPAIEPVRLS